MILLVIIIVYLNNTRYLGLSLVPVLRESGNEIIIVIIISKGYYTVFGSEHLPGHTLPLALH